MAYGPQSVSLTQAGGDLDLLEALRGGRGYRAKTQAQMLREQSMAPVEVGSYNGIQGKFPISQGLNKIAQGLLATYMEKRERGDAQATADAQKDEAQKWAAALGGAPAVAAQPRVEPQRGTVPGPVVDDVVPETPEAANFRIAMDQLRRDQPGQAGADYRASAPVFGMPGQRLEAAPGQGAPDDPGVVGRDAVAAQAGTGLTPAQRTASLMQGMGSGNPAIVRMAMHLSDQGAKAEIARQHNEMMGSNATQRANDMRDAANERAYNKHQPIFAKADAGFNTALANLDTTTGLIADITKHPKLGDVVAPKNSLIHYMPTITAEAEELQQKIKQLKATGSFGVLQELKKTGASLGAVTNADAERLDKAFSSLSLTTNPVIFKNELARIQAEVNKMRGRIAEQQGHAQQYAQSLHDRTQDPTAKLYVIPPPTPRPADAPVDDPQTPKPGAGAPVDDPQTPKPGAGAPIKFDKNGKRLP